MDLICPDCRGDLRMTSARWAVCAQHGGRFEVLFDRYAEPARPPVMETARVSSSGKSDGASITSDATASACRNHAQKTAVAACQSCGAPLCTLCSFDVNGTALCNDCAIAQAKASRGDKVCPSCGLSMPSSATRCDCGHQFGLLNLTAPRRRAAPSGTCEEHPEMPVVARCRLCAKAVCATCDFAMPGGVHLCPSCIESQSTEEISPKRKRQSFVALALAIWSTILFAILLSGAFNSLFTRDAGGKLADLAITNLILWPLLIGTALSIGALDKKLKNTGLMKAVAWWNGILAGIFFLLVIAVNTGLIGK